MSAPASTTRRRIGLGGAIAVALWLAIGFGLVSMLVRGYNPALIERYAPRYLDGLSITVTLVLVSFLIGALLSGLVAWGRMTQNPVGRFAASMFVGFFRGTPLIAQIFLIYYGLGQFHLSLESVGLWSFFKERWNCAIFALALNTAAYQGEILRGAIESVGRGQWEGARSLGLSRLAILWKIILPQAMIVALRPYANEIILMIKASAIVAIITVYDLMGETRRAYSATFDFQTYIWAALLYLAIVEVLRHLTNFTERRLTRHLKR